MKVNLYGKQLGLLPIIFVITGCIILISLGNWQLQRLEEKNNFIKTIENNIKNPAIPIESLGTNINNYSKVKISGKFLTNRNIYLYGRRSASPEKDGYYLLSAFAAENGKTYMVSRGWLPQTIKKDIDSLNQDLGTETIEAITLPGEKKNFFVPENDKQNNIWFTINLNMATDVLGTTVTDFYLMQINSHTIPEGVMPLKTNHLNKIRNDHLEYAITWYSLAACLVLMYLINIYKKNHRN